MDNRITTLADRLRNEVDPRLGDYVLELGRSGKSYDGIMEKLRGAMATAEALRAKDGAAAG